MLRVPAFLLCTAVLLGFTPALADDLTGASQLICAATTVILCYEEGDCVEGSPLELNVPQFIEVDLKGKRLSTTRASGEQDDPDRLTHAGRGADHPARP